MLLKGHSCNLVLHFCDLEGLAGDIICERKLLKVEATEASK